MDFISRSLELQRSSFDALMAELELFDRRYGLIEFTLTLTSDGLARRVTLWRFCTQGWDDDEDDMPLELRMFVYDIFARIYPPIHPEKVRRMFMYGDYSVLSEYIHKHLTEELRPFTPQEESYRKRVEKKLKEFVNNLSSNMKGWSSSAWNRSKSGARSIGVRVSETLKDSILSILDYIKAVISDSYHFILDFISRNLDILMSFLQDKMNALWSHCTSSYTAYASTFIGLVLIILAFVIPQGALSWYARCLTVGIGALTIYCRNLFTTTVAGALAYVMIAVRQHPLVINYNTNAVNMKTQSENFQKDLKTWLSSTVCAFSLISMSVAGLDIPTDKKTLDDMLKRHALLGRAYQTWNIVGDRLAEYIEESMRFVYKYVLKKEYVWFDHIPEVDKLFDDVTELCKINNASTIMRDQEKVDKIEAMYLQYMHLRRVYVTNKKIMQTLDLLGPPLIHFYKEICNRNPKGYVMRREPVCIMIKGDSGKGKTFISNILAQSLLKICGKYDPDEDLSGKIYARAHEQVYWDGYVGQPIVIFDDFGQMVDSASNPNLEYHELIRGVNVFPFQLHSAALEMKGNNPFEADFVVLTTNLEKVDPASLISSDAVQRRIHVTVEIDIIDCVKKSTAYGTLDKTKLDQYRRINNLPEDDTSHCIFKVNGAVMSYDRMIVYISQQYKNKLDTHHLQEKIAQRNRETPLPRGCFSVDPKWIPEGEEEKTVAKLRETNIPFHQRHGGAQADIRNVPIPLPLFLNAKPTDQRRLLQYHRIMYADVFPSMLDQTTFNSYEELVGYVELSPICIAYTNHPDAYQVDAEVLKVLCTIKDEAQKEYVKKKIFEDSKERYEKMKEEKNKMQFWEKFIGRVGMIMVGSYDWFTSADTTYEKFWFALGALLCMVCVIGYVFTLYNMVGSLFPDSYLKASLLRFVKWSFFCSTVMNFTAMNFAIEHPALISGFTNFAAFACAFVHHYLSHPEYKEGCLECELHKKVHSLFQKEDLDKGKECEVSVNDAIKLAEELNTKTMPAPKPQRQKPEDDPSHGRQTARTRTRVKYEESDLDCMEHEDDPSHGKQSGRTKHRVKFEEEEQEQVVNPLMDMFPGMSMVAEGCSSRQAVELAGKLRRNMIHLSVEYDGEKHSVGTTIALKGRIALINFHYFQSISVMWEHAEDKETFRCLFKQHEFADGHRCHLKDLVASAKVVHRGGVKTEFYTIELPQSMNLFADITKHLINPSEVSKLALGVPLIMATYIKEGGKYVQRQNTGPFVELFTATVEDRRDPSIIHSYPMSVKYEMQTQAGDCGSPILIASDAFQHKILGFHFAGSEGFGACSIITFPDVEKIVRKQDCAADPNMVTQGNVEDFPLLDSSFRFVGESITRPVVQPCRTVLRKSLVHGFMGPSTVAPARLRPALEPNGPMLNGLKKNAGGVFPLDPYLVASSVLSYEENIMKFMAHGDEQRVLTFEESCRGIIGNKFFPPLKRSKSAGFPLMFEASKGKTDWLGEDEWDFDSPKCKELREMVNTMEDECRRGIVPEVYFVDTLKDEKRSLEKVAEGKTRVFSAAPLTFSVLCRKYMLGFVAFMSRTRIGNECAVGTCVYSEDWKWIVEHLKGFGEKSLIAGDFSNFDGTVAPDLFIEIVNIINRFYGDSEQNQHVRRILWECISKSNHVLYNFMYMFSHGQPSGNPTTAVSNSIYNSLAIRYCYGLLGLDLRSFNDNVKVIVYGDDNIIAVHPAIRHQFNPSTLSAAFTSIGMTYTSEEKEAQGVEFRSISEITFLKRSFSYDSRLDWWFAPLSLQSIIESMNWIKKSPSYLEATLSNCMDAKDELFHHSEDTYNRVYTALQAAWRKHGYRVIWDPWKIGRENIVRLQENSIGEDKRYI